MREKRRRDEMRNSNVAMRYCQYAKVHKARDLPSCLVITLCISYHRMTDDMISSLKKTPFLVTVMIIACRKKNRLP